MTETVTCEWCGTVVPWEIVVDIKPYNHPLSVCPECLP